MDEKFVKLFMDNKEKLKETFRKKSPDDYEDIVREVVKIISAGEDYNVPDPDRIERIDHGDYQGTILFIIGAKGYQPSAYWYVMVNYGSCSGCDCLQNIYDAEEEAKPDEYVTLALHLVQGLKKLEE